MYIVDSGTSFRVAYEAFDPDPKKILSPLRDRDKAYEDDSVGFQLDTFDTMQRALWFYVSARGVQMDGTYDETTDRDNDSWDAIWDSGAQLTEQGYTVEFEIPYSSLKFRQTKKAQQWNIKFQRFRPRENYFKYANVKKDRNNNCNLCQQAKIIGSVLAAVAGSGVAGPRWSFEGFLPRSGRERKARLAAIAGDERGAVLFEGPNRVAATLADLVAACGPDRAGAVCRELTKLHEQIVRGTLGDLAGKAADGSIPARGEVVIVVGWGRGMAGIAADADARDDALEAARARVDALVAGGVARGEAAKRIAAESGLPRRALYAAPDHEPADG